MRREFILVLLGIISISTFSSLLTGYVQIETNKILIDTVNGNIGAGNFTYWHLGYTGPLLIELTSITGDADMYVSESLRPSYEVDQNNFSSTTCGLDVVRIPELFPRPIGIAVFGDWSYEASDYSIKIFLDTSTESEDITSPGDRIHYPAGKQKFSHVPRHRDTIVSRKLDENEKSKFVKLLSILDMVFEMFVL